MSDKQAKLYKGYEIWWAEKLMTAKMYVISFLIVVALQAIIIFVVAYIVYGELFSTMASYVSRSILALRVPNWERLGNILAGIAVDAWPYIILSCVVWLLYPIMMGGYKLKARGIIDDKHLRGSKLTSPDALNRKIRRAYRIDDTCLPLGSIRLPKEYEGQHGFISGRAGTGKTTLLNDILIQVKKNKSKIIIHDMKGDYVAKFFDPATDKIFNPLDSRGLKWSILHEVSSLPDIESLTHSLIPPSIKDDKFWVDASRDVFFSIIFYLVRNNQKTNRDLWDILSLSEPDLLELMQSAVANGLQECRKALGYLQGHSSGSKVASDVLSTLKQYTNCFLYLRESDGDFCLKNWILDTKPGAIFVVNYRQLKDTLRPILSLLIDLSAKYTLSLVDDNSRRIYYIIDEYAQLQRMPATLELLEAGRSKGASCWLACQDINQLRDLYGPDKTGSIINNCSTTITFGIGDPVSQDYLSKLYGDIEIAESKESNSMGPDDMHDGLSISRSRKITRLILPSQLGNLEKFHYFLKLHHHDIVRDKVQWHNIPQQHPALMELSTYNITAATADIKL